MIDARKKLLWLALACAIAFAPAAQAQVRQTTRSSVNVSPLRLAPPRLPPLRAGPNGVHSATPIRSAVTAPAGTHSSDPQCAQGQCSQGQVVREQVIPARASGDLVQGGGVVSATAVGPGVSSSVGTVGTFSSNGQPMITPAPEPEPAVGNVLIRQQQSVRITIRAISAERADSALEIDGRLSPIDHDLRSFADQFSYRSYRLLDVQTFDLDFRSIAQMELPGSRAIEVEPRLLGPDGRVKVHLELLGQHPGHAPRMRTDYSIPRGRTILVGGYRINPEQPERGTLLIAITQDE